MPEKRPRADQHAVSKDVTHGSDRGARGWSLKWYFALLAALFIATAAVALGYVRADARQTARATALADARSTARIAATELGADLATLAANVHQVSSVAGVADVLAHPARCSLSSPSTPTGLATTHIDILRDDGSLVCSSSSHAGSIARAAWLARAAAGPILVAPVRDPVTGQMAAVEAAPIAHQAVVAGYADLTPVGSLLASLYGDGHPVEILATTAAANVVVASSAEPSHWVGRSIAGTPFAREKGAIERTGLDDRARLFVSAAVPGAGWRIYVGYDNAAALARGTHLANGQLLIILVGLAAILLVVYGVYAVVAGPITRLAAAVRTERLQESHEPMPTGGPAQVRSLAGAIDGLIGAVQDQLTERRRAEHATAVAEQSYRLLFESSPMAMWIFDAETEQVLEANQSATELYGYRREELLKLRADALLAPERAAHPGPRGDGAEDPAPLRHIKKDGAEIEVSVARHAVQFQGRKATFVLASDIGDREALARQLRQSQRLESLGQLAGGVAHDFNNLIGVIIGYLGFVSDDLATEAEADGGERWTAVRDQLQQIERAAQSAARLTRQLLLFARRDVGRKEIIDVNSVVEQIEDVLHHTLGEHVLLQTRLDPEAWPVAIDPGQLEQVLVNLAVNARDAMPDGGTLTVDTSNLTLEAMETATGAGVPTGPYLRLRVTDSGIGMDEETVDRAFEPFFTTKPRGEGSGLGLATIYGIVTQAGGRIQIYSEPGHGTTISVLLPASGARPAERRPDTRSARGGNETVLLVEDEPTLRELTCRMLERNGYTVLAVAGGAEAVELAGGHGNAIALLITDVVMPQMLGHEVAERVTELIPDIPVLYVSGYPEPLLGAQGKLDPTAELLEKPFTERALLARIRALLDRQSRPTPVER